MPSDNRVILASAGSGKTTSIVDEACKARDCRSELITYTLNGRAELSDKAYYLFKSIPPHVRISTWYTFVLQHFVRPYQAHLHPKRVSTINFQRGRTARGVKKTNIGQYFFSGDKQDRLRLDKVTDFACELVDKTKGLPIDRYRAIIDHLYIDEAQDLSGYDLELVEMLLKAGLRITMIGDCRQATYTTNDSPKNKAYVGVNIVKKFVEWEKAGLLQIEHQAHSHRCVQEICDFADKFHPDFKNTQSLNKTVTGHDGVFAVRQSDVAAYCEKYIPQPLRYDRRTKNAPANAMNYGAVKGMTFERTLIFPHGPLLKYLATGDLKDAGKEIAKLYVAVTRARQSAAYVIPDGLAPAMLPVFDVNGD